MPNIWKVSPGRNARFWDRCREKKCISINWLEDIDLTGYSRNEILAELKRRKEGKGGSASSIWTFVNLIKPKDIVVANQGLSGIVGIGLVRSEYLKPNHSKNPNRQLDFHRHVHLVDWQITEPANFTRQLFNQGTVHRLGEEETQRIKERYIADYPELQEKLRRLFPGFLRAESRVLMTVTSQTTRILARRHSDKSKSGGASQSLEVSSCGDFVVHAQSPAAKCLTCLRQPISAHIVVKKITLRVMEFSFERTSTPYSILIC